MTDITLPVDSKPSRLNRPGPVSSFDPDDISTVDAKVDEFWDRYPEGAIDASDIEQIGEQSWRVTAYVWRLAPSKQFEEKTRADSSASATRTYDPDGHASGVFPLETAQSVAIGRALRFLGIRGEEPNQKSGSE